MYVTHMATHHFVTRNKVGWKISEILFELLEGKPGVFKGILVCECSVWFPLA